MNTLSQVAIKFGLKRQRIHQLIKQGRMKARMVQDPTIGKSGFYYEISDEELNLWKRIKVKDRTYMVRKGEDEKNCRSELRQQHENKSGQL